MRKVLSIFMLISLPLILPSGYSEWYRIYRNYYYKYGPGKNVDVNLIKGHIWK